MNARVYGVGVVAGIVLIAVLNYPLNIYLPGAVVASLPQGQASLAWGMIVIGVLIILFTGAVAARMSGTSDRRGAAVAGAIAGLIAAMSAEMMLGGAAAGVWGSREILAFGLKHTQSDSQFLGMIAEAVASTHLWTYTSLWIAVGAGMALGALGGAVAGNGGTPAQPHPELLPTLSLAGVLASALTLVVAVVIFTLLGPSVQRAANESGRAISISGEMLNGIVILTNYAMLIVWQIFGWWSARRLQTTESPALRAMAMTASMFAGAIPILTVVLLIFIASQAFFAWWMIVSVIISLAISAFTLRAGWQMRGNRGTVTAGRISIGTMALIGALISGIIMATSYISAVAVSLNVVLLVIPMIATLAIHDAAKAAEEAATLSGGVPILVQSNFATHAGVLFVSIGMTLFLALLGRFFGWVMNRWLAARK